MANYDVSWIELEYTLASSNSITASINSGLQTNDNTITASVDARVVTQESITTSVDSALLKVGSITTGLSAYLSASAANQIAVGLDAALDRQRTVVSSIDAAVTVSGSGVSTRNITSALATALSADEIAPFFALDLEFSSGELNLWTGYGDVTINGKTYNGAGNMLSISDIEETSDIKAAGATLQLSGIPSSILSLALNEPYQGRICTVYFGVTSDTTEMTEIFSGYMDQMNIAESGETSTIELTVENKLVDLEKVKSIRYTSAYQKSKYPNDKGLDFVEDLQDKNLVWGRSSS